MSERLAALVEAAKQSVLAAAAEAWQEYQSDDTKDEAVGEDAVFMLGFIKGATWQVDR